MKQAFALALCLLAAGAASAEVLQNTPAINGTYTITAPSSTTNDLTGVGLFTNPNNGETGTAATYYSGTISANYSQYQAGIRISLVDTDGSGTDGHVFSIGDQRSDGNHVWGYWLGTAGNQTDFSPAASATEDLNFQIKVSNEPWNKATIELFIGSNATAAGEGSPDITLTGQVLSYQLNQLVVVQEHAGVGGEATISSFAVGDEWISGTPASTEIIIASAEMQTATVKKLVVDPDTDDPATYYPVSTTNPVDGPWSDVAHANNPHGPYIITNLNYAVSGPDGLSFYVKSENEHFGIEIR